MLVMPLPMVTLVSLVQSPKTLPPMLVTLLGIVTLARLVHSKKALSLMLVTVLPVRSRFTYLFNAPLSADLIVGNSLLLVTFRVIL
jgi:hypothetical protein